MGLGELGARVACSVGHQTLLTMESPSPGSPADPGEAPAPPPGKWALVRSLNQALKTFAVLPVSPGPGGEGSAAWTSVPQPIRLQVGCRGLKCMGDCGPRMLHRTRDSGVKLAEEATPPREAFAVWKIRDAVGEEQASWTKLRKEVPASCWCLAQEALQGA